MCLCAPRTCAAAICVEWHSRLSTMRDEDEPHGMVVPVAGSQDVGIMSSIPTGADSAPFHLIFQFLVRVLWHTVLLVSKGGKTTHQSSGGPLGLSKVKRKSWCRGRLQFACQLCPTPEKIPYSGNTAIILAQFRGFCKWDRVLVFLLRCLRETCSPVRKTNNIIVIEKPDEVSNGPDKM